MRAIIVKEPNVVEVIDIAKPEDLGPYQALVKTDVACLCNATDAKLIDGHFPGVEDYPLALGHESAGFVEAVGEKVKNFSVGDKAIGGLLFDFKEEIATGWGGFCEYTLINDHDAMVADGVADEAHGWFECYEIQRTVPEDIALEEAVMMCTWREVYGGFGDFDLTAGQDIMVFGAGPVGLSFTKFGKLLGLGKITVVDPLAHKREKAMAMGADEVLTPEEAASEAYVEKNKNRFDRIIDAVGHENIINTAIPLIKMGGSVCVYGVVGQSSINLNHGKGPHNFNLLIHQWPTRHRESAAMEPLCQWIRDGKLTAAEFCTHEFKIEEINAALDAVKSGEVVKVLLRY